MQDLGKLEKIQVRNVWEHEAHDFTPWLAENLSELGEALGLDLDDAQYEEEASVGSYFADILAQVVEGDRPVIIENQLEKTNHDHLGKLLTYAAGYNAGVIVWIASEFTDEHRAAVDWLNQETGEGVDFFGVIVEAWKIGSSPVAPHFTVVAMPNSWSNRDKSSMSTNTTSDRQERQMEFFQKLIDTLREEHKFTKRKKAKARSWASFPSGTSGANLGAAFGQIVTSQVCPQILLQTGKSARWSSFKNSLTRCVKSISSLNARKQRLEVGPRFHQALVAQIWVLPSVIMVLLGLSCISTGRLIGTNQYLTNYLFPRQRYTLNSKRNWIGTAWIPRRLAESRLPMRAALTTTTMHWKTYAIG